MPTIHIAQPTTILAPHKVTTAEILDDIRAHHPNHPRLPAILRIVANTGVQTRYFARPLTAPTVSGPAGVADRAPAAFHDALTLAEQAAHTALHRHGLEPADIDGIVTTHSTGWAVPGIDIHLIQRLGLRPTVRRASLTTLACAGGTQALIRATDLAAHRPGARILVVAAEAISAIYNHADTAVEHMIYKALFGDSAAATIVSTHPHGPGLTVHDPVDDSLEYVLPHSLDRYSGRIDETGLHFDSTREALTAADDVLPALTTWLGTRTVDIPVIHPGSQRIITDTATAVGLTDNDAHHSLDTLTEEGNLGGVSVLRVLERTHDTPPADGAGCLVVAYGPGFSMSALHATWTN